MQNGHRMPKRFESIGDLVGCLLGSSEDYDAFIMCLLEQRDQQIEFLSNRHWVKSMGDSFGHGAAHPNLNNLRVSQNPGGKRFDLGRNRRGKE